MNVKRITRLVLLLLAGLARSMPALGENWRQWRGQGWDGISHEKNLPQTWSKTENVAWRFALPGAAGATPVVWEDHIYLTSAEDDNLVLIAISTEGKQL